MRSLYAVAAVLSAVLAIAPNGRAQEVDTTKQELHEFDAFLDPNPSIGSEVTHNPALLKDAAYLRQHPELNSFLNSHTQIRTEINENPNAFMQGVDRYRAEVHEFDAFLKSHPQVHSDLMGNANLANDPGYLSKHEALQAFLSSHPGVRSELKFNAASFMAREKGYERWMSDRSHPHKASADTDRDQDKRKHKVKAKERDKDKDKDRE
jgi:hypothetical protein